MNDTRPRGEWSATPLFLRLIGFSPMRRPVYAHYMIGGGVDEWEYTRPTGGGNNGE
ncbi:hypothetical protein ABE527_14360 [Brucella sp. TWI432]